MVVRVVEFVDDDKQVTNSARVESGVTVVSREVTPLVVTKTVAGVVIPITGQNLVQNAVVSATPPLNPYEGQVWIDIS